MSSTHTLFSDRVCCSNQSEHVLYQNSFINSDITWVFDQSEHAQGPIYSIL